ncbi:HNH endonuclease [Mycobacterium phage Gattaca]|uniref:HNH endonuclease n=1 Tax=Mycobacterium phage Gattaca TaxID=1852567 RepID=A0A192Y9P7_9CAUD|nr:HNH endonuclease [Mycobacterium phage Gattaca]
MVAKGLCSTHYKRERDGRDLEAPWTPRIKGGATCQIEGCGKRAVSFGLCNTHAYQRDTGAEVGPRRALRASTMAERLEFYSAPPNEKGCRLWLGGINASGYPTVSPMAGYSSMAHRAAYKVAHPDEELGPHEVVHHICGVTWCVEPTHLQKVNSTNNTAEMLERNWYLKRIAELEAEVARLSPDIH